MKYPYAILDYGIGGMGLYKLIRKEFPKIPVVYFSDSGEVPYGKLTAPALRKRIKKVIGFLKGIGAEKILVACHSASSIIRPEDKNVIDIRRATLHAVPKKSKHLLILGGGRTIRDGYYRAELEKRSIKVTQRIAQELSILVERGETKSSAAKNAVKRLVTGSGKYDGLLLACTHYPALVPEFNKHLDDGTELIDPSNQLYKSIRKDLAQYKHSGLVKSIFLTTGNPKLMKEAAFKAFGVKVTAVKRVSLR